MADIFGWLYSLIYKSFCSERMGGHCLSKDKKGIKKMLNDTLMITLLILAGADKEDVDIKSNEYWEYYKSTYGENNLIILKRNKK